MDQRTLQSKGSSLSKKTMGTVVPGSQTTLKRFQNLIAGSKIAPTNKQGSPMTQMHSKMRVNEVSLWMNNKENRRPTGSLTKSITPTAKSSGNFQKFSHFLSPLLVAKTINSSLQKKLKTAGVKSSFENRLKILEAKNGNEYNSAAKSITEYNSQANGVSFRKEEQRPKLSSARLSPDPKGQSPFQISINIKTNSRDKRKSNFIRSPFKPLTSIESVKVCKADQKNALRSNSKDEFNLYNKRTIQPVKGQSPSLRNITFSNFLNSVKDSTKTLHTPGIFTRKAVEQLSLPDLFRQYSLFMQLHDILSSGDASHEFLQETYTECFQPEGLVCPQRHLNPKSESFSQIRLALRIQRAVLAVICASKDVIFNIGNRAKDLMARLCLAQYYILLLLKRYQKSLGETESAKYIASFLKLPSFKLRFSPPMDIISGINEINSQLSIDLEKYLDCFSHNLRRQQLSIMIKSALNLKKSEADLTSQISELFIENKPALLSSQSALSQSEQQTGARDSKGHTETSLFGDDEDPYFILQPLRSESFLPSKRSTDKAYTLVLDLDETLVHFEESTDGGQFLVRPYAQEFLSKMQDHFEVVIFTAAVKDYADWILDRIDLTKAVSHRLYRHHTSLQNGVYMKDLSKLGRDLNRTIIIDNNAENFQLQPDNGIYIKTWHDDPHDIALKQLAKLLVRILEEGEEDIRVALRKTQQKLAQRTRGA